MTTVIKTIALKLRSPGAQKRAVIEYAMRNYARAFQRLLDVCGSNIKKFEGELKKRPAITASALNALIPQGTLSALNEYGVQPFKDSLKKDFAVTIAAYLALKKRRKYMPYPVVRIEPRRYDELFAEASERFESGEMSKREFSHEIDRMLSKLEAKKSVYFGRYDRLREYCLLYDEKKDRYFAKMYLLCSTEKRPTSSTGGKLMYICEGGGYIEPQRVKERYIVAPLEFGEYQREILERARSNPSILKTARLVERSGEYYLMVNVECECAEEISAENTMGVARAVTGCLHYTVCAPDGVVIESGGISTQARSGPEALLHTLANEVTSIALRTRSQVIMNSLSERGDSLYGREEAGKYSLSGSQYNALSRILQYKLRLGGLKKPALVSPNSVFFNCPSCNMRSKDNRALKDVFMCVNCGYSAPVEEVGSMNLARRLEFYKNNRIKFSLSILDGRPTIYNRSLGFTYSPEKDGFDPIGFFEGFYEGFYSELEGFINAATLSLNRRNPGSVRKFGMLLKLKNADKLQDVIEIVEKR